MQPSVKIYLEVSYTGPKCKERLDVAAYLLACMHAPLLCPLAV